MKKLIASLTFIILLSQTGSANFLWATKAFWLKAHKEPLWELVKVETKSPFVTEMLQIRPKKKDFAPGVPIQYEHLLILVGDRVMAYYTRRLDGEHMKGEDIKFCLSAAREKETSWDEPIQKGNTISWMRSDKKVMIEYDHELKAMITADFGYWMLDKSMATAMEMKENGLGDRLDWNLSKGKE